MRRFPIATIVLMSSSLLLGSARAEAQTIGPFIEELFFQDIVDTQEDPSAVLQQARDSAQQLSTFTAIALATVPVVSSSAGLVYVRDRASGEVLLKTPSFGPSFVERPLTNGRGVFNLGVNYQFSRINFSGGFDTADKREEGLPLFDNTATYTADGFVQYITKRAFLEARSHAVNVFTSYGITSRLDVGAVVPITSLRVAGRTEETYDVSRNWNANEGDIRVDRPTPAGINLIEPETRLSATGLGDISLRVKYSIVERGATGVAVSGDLRLPTGDEAQLLGAGDPSFRLAILAAVTTVGSASLHANAGYTAGGLTDEIVYSAGIDSPLLPQQRLTASFSFLGREVRDGALPERIATVRRVVNTGPTGERAIVVDRFFWSSTRLSLLQLAAGAKVNLGGDWLLNGSVLIPINRTGFQPGITPAIGLERKWGQPRL
jgi:hypothetical protein